MGNPKLAHSDELRESSFVNNRKKPKLFLVLLEVAVCLALMWGTQERCNGEGTMSELGKKQTNRLAKETSPYLLQHADNPVDWYPWGTEALARAKKEDKPIFLSIGYSACHWCHVMERESFRNQEVATAMNKYFVCIKVDREERPDLDEIYMNAVQAMTGSGGWPLTVLLTPNLKPFFGGTYIPPQSLIGPGHFLEKAAKFYHANRDEIEQGSDRLVKQLEQIGTVPKHVAAGGARIEAELLATASRELLGRLDAQHGGFIHARGSVETTPKFPQPARMLFLLEEYLRTHEKPALEATTFTLHKMAAGGIYDHLAGGFHRYSVDGFWRVPHFEKMLYDNALLAQAYLRAFQVTSEPKLAAITRQTLDFMLAEMQDSAGGFCGTIDADSEHKEGAYYVWTLAEIKKILDVDTARRFAEVYGVTAQGNASLHAGGLSARTKPDNGENVLYQARDISVTAKRENLTLAEFETELAESRAKLLQVRSTRIRPATDRKIITAWNGMAISAFARAGVVLDETRYVTAARHAADFVLQQHRIENDRNSLARSSINGRISGPAFLDDYAYFIVGLLDLYHATLEDTYLLAAARRATEMLVLFSDPAGGALFFAPAPEADDIQLLVRPRKLFGGSVPSPVAVAWDALLRLADLTGKPQFTTAASGQERALAQALGNLPGGGDYALAVAAGRLRPHLQITVVGLPNDESTLALVRAVRKHGDANTSLLLVDPADKGDRLRALSDRARTQPMVKGLATAYVCKGQTCLAPVTKPGALRARLQPGTHSP